MDFLILHGWGSCAENWQKVKEGLELAGHKVYLPDLPGFGENPPLSRPWSIDDYVEWVREFSQKNSLSQFFLLGHSFGGAIAVKYALKSPQKIKKLFLVSPALIRRKTLKKETIKKTAKIFFFLPPFIKRIIYKEIIKSDYPQTAGPMKETYLRVIKEDLSAFLSNISIPVFLIWGKKDQVTPLKDSYFIKDKILGAELKIIPEVFHNPQSEAPQVLVKEILSLIKL